MSKSAQQIRVLSYNIHHCNPPTKPEVIDVDAVANLINSQRPDVVALQEVDVNTKRGGNINQAQLLAQKTGLHLYFAKAIDFDGGEFGNAILSRFPIFKGHTFPLPSIPELKGEPRVLATIEIKLPDGFEFVFAATHLDSLEEEANRLLQMEAINEKLARSGAPTILAGDFNATPESAPIKVLDRFFQHANSKGEPTFPADKPTETIDYIAYRPTEAFTPIFQQVTAEVYASDHRPVLCVFQINKK